MTKRKRPLSPPSGTAPMYLSRLPKPGEVPAGLVIVHNHVQPARGLGTRGFRAWLQPTGPLVEPCVCGWAPELEPHYRVRRDLLLTNEKRGAR